MPEQFRGDSSSRSNLDELLDKYAEELKLTKKEANLFFIEKNGSKNDIKDQTHCEFEDTCYAFKFKKGTCPCELIR